MQEEPESGKQSGERLLQGLTRFDLHPWKSDIAKFSGHSKKHGNRELEFPVTRVIIPCSLELEETKLTAISHIYSA